MTTGIIMLTLICVTSMEFLPLSRPQRQRARRNECFRRLLNLSIVMALSLLILF